MYDPHSQYIIDRIMRLQAVTTLLGVSVVASLTLLGFSIQYGGCRLFLGFGVAMLATFLTGYVFVKLYKEQHRLDRGQEKLAKLALRKAQDEEQERSTNE